ncbi:helicase-primase primase subunit [Panine betaherpesvirus 2]|uniref:Helicase-primase primase subunit n=1 Tax=Panine betaherpesvirus 2 TaxID=188763 RepID=Q8QS29_9BETA|nr:helicase-primase primase subunit [Panine betaherpesvirus 2]AAM00709.1 helicase-primase primase subunit [Panine betaherpesvirus 2]QXV67816.1 helicase-primase primase subunit [Panine betaherpesvirus 2]
MTLVLFATEYDSAHIVTNVLAQTASEHCVYPLLVKHHASRRVYFCLQTQKCTDSRRVAPVFAVDNDVLNLSRYLTARQPIPLSALIASLDEAETRPLYSHLFRTVISPEHGGEVREFKHLVYFHHAAVLRHLNLVFLCPTSPSWFISTFGHTEGQVLLSMAYYLFEGQYSTVPTVEEYVRSFCAGDLGPVIPTHASMSEFARLLLGSPFRQRVPQFVAYAVARNRRDLAELTHVDAQINTFREHARLPDTVCVHYVYLAYRTALARQRLLEYRRVVAYDETAPAEQQCTREPLFLGRRLAGDLIQVMERYFSLDNFLHDYVETRLLPLGSPHQPHPASYPPPSHPQQQPSPAHPPCLQHLRMSGYGYRTDGASLTGFFGTSSQLLRKLDQINRLSDSVFSSIERSLSGVLRLCASLRTAQTYATGALARFSQRRYLLPPELAAAGAVIAQPLPLYRVHLPNDQHVFCAVFSETWHRSMFPFDLLKHVPDSRFTDEALTDMIWLHDDDVASASPETQFYYTRHEIFNERLPVFNFVADMDLRLRDGVSGLSKHTVFEICRGLRRVWIAVWTSLFGYTYQDRHPVYFFKSACRHPGVGAHAHDDDAADAYYDGDEYLNFENEEHEGRDATEEGEMRREEEGQRVGESRHPKTKEEEGGDATGDKNNSPLYCRCTEKLGLRIITPFPANTVVLNPAVLRAVAQVLNHALCLDTQLHRLLDPISHPENSLDTGIYHHGRSVRLPYMYKMDQDDGYFMYRRLLPLFIVPEAYRDRPLGFVRAQLDLRNLLHHHPPHDLPAFPISPPPRIVLSVQDKICPSPDANFIETRSLNVTRYQRRALADVLSYHLYGAPRAERGDDDAVVVYETELQRLLVGRVWPPLLEHLTRHYEAHVSEQFTAPNVLLFQPHGLSCVAVKRRDGSRTRDFRCLNYVHRNPQETVQVFIDLRTEHSYALWASLWSRCFTKKCHSNAKNVHISVKIRPPGADAV